VTRQASENEVGERIEAMRRRPQRFRDERITMAHGAGGKASRALVEGLIVPLLTNPALEQLTDAGLITVAGARLALTTDAYVVRPTGWRPGTSAVAVRGRTRQPGLRRYAPSSGWPARTASQLDAPPTPGSCSPRRRRPFRGGPARSWNFDVFAGGRPGPWLSVAAKC
jgi:hypothetical protein